MEITMVHVIAINKARPGMRARVLQFLRANKPAVLAERGCVEYFVTVDARDAPGLQAPLGDDGFVVFERWADMDAFHAHANAPHVLTYRDNVRDLIAEKAVHVLNAL
jgi:quinol monooxygenase YgiN